MGGKRWTTEELEYLRENWGNKSIATIAYTLGRSRNAVLVKKKTNWGWVHSLIIIRTEL